MSSLQRKGTSVNHASGDLGGNMTEEKAATTVQEPGVTEGFEAAVQAAEKPAEPAATQEAAATGEDAEEPKAPGTWEDLEQTEWFPTAYEERRKAAVEEAKPDIFREAKSAAYSDLQGRFQEDSNRLQNLHQTTQVMTGAWSDALEDFAQKGGEPKELQRVLRGVLREHPAWSEAVNGEYWGKGQEFVFAALADVSGDPHLLSEFYDRIKNGGLGTKQQAVEFLDRLTEARMRDRIKESNAAAVKPKDEEIARITAQLNQIKGTTRTEGPTKLPGSAGGGKKYSELTPDERRAMSSKEIDAMLAREEER